jgi:ubiquitin carboxyl-terminal hydrolase L5
MLNDWKAIESDPAIFTLLLEKLGVVDVKTVEILNIGDLEIFKDFSFEMRFFVLCLYRTVYGLIFLYNYSKKHKRDKANKTKIVPRVRAVEAKAEFYPSLFFAKQVAVNSCCTHALVSLVLNRSEDIDIGTDLKNFKEFTVGQMSPQVSYYFVLSFQFI